MAGEPFEPDRQPHQRSAAIGRFERDLAADPPARSECTAPHFGSPHHPIGISEGDDQPIEPALVDQQGLRTRVSARRGLKLAAPQEHVILPETISKEPLGPAVRHGDDQWFDLVKWTLFAMVNAEELGVGQGNAEAMRASGRPDVRRLLGIEGDFGEALGLNRDWAYRILYHVGNYGESFERNLGRDSPLRIERGQNALWTRGGLQYAPPIR